MWTKSKFSEVSNLYSEIDIVNSTEDMPSPKMCNAAPKKHAFLWISIIITSKRPSSGKNVVQTFTRRNALYSLGAITATIITLQDESPEYFGDFVLHIGADILSFQKALQTFGVLLLATQIE